MYSTTQSNPYVNIIDLKIKSTKENLIENTKNLINSTTINIDDINSRLSLIEKEIKKLPTTERNLINIQRRYNLNDHIYNYLLEKRAEAGIAKASNTADNRIIDPARLVGTEPIYPKTKFVFGIAILLSLILPTLTILITDFFTDKIKSKEELSTITSIPVLGMIGHSKGSSNLIVLANPKSALSESFRSIRINLQYLAVNKEKKVIGITSSVSGEGKTFCSINLASIIAMSGKKVILIGADLRKPKIYDDFELNNEKGLSSYLINQFTITEIIQHSGVDNLDIISSGPIPPNPSELLSNKDLTEMFAFLKENYEYIILDTPPLGLVSEYFILLKYIDINIYIVRHNYTRRKHLEKINELYSDGKIKDLSIIINDISGADLYGYGYEYGYNYYNGNGYFQEKSGNNLQSILKKIST